MVKGPLRFWQHRHSFRALQPERTLIGEEIEFEYPPGIAGWWTRLVYSPIALRLLFFYRSQITRWILERRKQA
jgi:ligand-binding SRPBCC domain-containing protein